MSNYDRSSRRTYLDGRRVKIAGTYFSDNDASNDGSIPGLVTLVYSLTVTDCLFGRNSANSMVFLYNDYALVDDTMFAENTAEVSMVILSSPRESDNDDDDDDDNSGHRRERGQVGRAGAHCQIVVIPWVEGRDVQRPRNELGGGGVW